MPMTYAEHDKKMKSPAVCELLPLRDLPQGDNVMVRTNGAFVAGYELKGVLSYFATDEDRNQAKSMLEVLTAASDSAISISFSLFIIFRFIFIARRVRIHRTRVVGTVSCAPR
jgi:hypothetical protein